MKQSGSTTVFVIVCIAVLLAAYGIGIGIRGIRFRAVEPETSAAAKSDKPADESEEKTVAANTAAAPESPGESEEEVSGEEEPGPRPERPEGERMMGRGMGERFQNMSEEERQEFMARMQQRGGSRRREGRGGFPQISEEDKEKIAAEMEELQARADELSEEEMREARREIMQKYGMNFRGGGGGRPGGGQGGRRRSDGGDDEMVPPKGRACFVAETPVWVDGKLVQISKVTAGQTVGRQLCGALPLEQVHEHEGTFDCRDIVLESGNSIGVVDAHCFMLDSGKWIAAQNLTSGLRLKTLTGTVGIKSVTKRAVPYTGKVYNLKVGSSDQYMVGKDAVIVRDY
jgi:hypothetical protein